MRKTLRSTLHLAVLVAVLFTAVGLSGCALDRRKTLTGVSETQFSNGVEPYFNVGPMTYQVQESRQLNPFSTEDVQFLSGVKGAQDISPDQFWYGVFLWAKNQSGRIADTASDFKLVDSSGTVYEPTALNPSINPYAWSGMALDPNGTEPGPDSTASLGFSGGQLILFKVNQSVYSNRPLTLEIYAPGTTTHPSQVSLDL